MSEPTRNPTPFELEEIISAAVDSNYGPLACAEERAEVRGHLAACAIVDNYTTDGPGYSGPVALVLWAADPSAVSVYTWHDGLWVEEERES